MFIMVHDFSSQLMQVTSNSHRVSNFGPILLNLINSVLSSSNAQIAFRVL